MNPSLVSILAIGVLASSAASQTATTLLTGSALSPRTGQDVANAGDVDRDGVDDIIIGIEEDSTGPLGRQFTGRATLISGATRQVIHSWVGDFIGDRLGCAVDGAGDVDGDGIPDVVVGARGVDKLDAPPYYGDAGSVYVFSGAPPYNTLFRVDCWQLTNPSFVVDDAKFGYSVAGAGDVDADGFADIIVGAYVGFRPAFPGEGAAVVISGKTWQTPTAPQVLHTFLGGGPSYFLGFAVDGAGDVNGDYYDDLIVGAVDANGLSGNGGFAGEARIYDGQTGALIDTLSSGNAGDFFGGSVAGVGDVDGDGLDDVACGIVFEGGTGGAKVYSSAFLGMTPRPLGFEMYSFTGLVTDDLFGFDVNGGGDMDGDGHPDIIVGAILQTGTIPVSGVVKVYSGATGGTLATFNGTQIGGAYGFSVALGGDHDGDGFAEAIVGTPYHDVGPVVDAGIAELLDLDLTGTPPRVRQVGPGCVALRDPLGTMTQVLPTLQLRGRAALGETFSVRLRGCPLSQPWILNIGAPVNINLTPFGLTGCWLYSTGNGFVFQPSPPVTDPVHGTGLFNPGVPIPVNTALINQNIYLQANILAPGSNPAGVVVSNGLELTFGN